MVARGPGFRIAPGKRVTVKRRAAVALGGGSIALGSLAVLLGSLANGSAATSGGGGTPGAGFMIAGALMIGVPLLCVAIAIIRSVIRSAVHGARAYAAWRKMLTPEQLERLRAAEAVSLFVLGEELHRHWRRHNLAKSAEITDKIIRG
jgi:hypothetical protein